MPAKPYQIGTLLDVVCGMNVFERLERQICSLVAGGTAESIELLALVVGSAGHSLRFKCVFGEIGQSGSTSFIVKPLSVTEFPRVFLRGSNRLGGVSGVSPVRMRVHHFAARAILLQRVQTALEVMSCVYRRKRLQGHPITP